MRQLLVGIAIGRLEVTPEKKSNAHCREVSGRHDAEVGAPSIARIVRWPLGRRAWRVGAPHGAAVGIGRQRDFGDEPGCNDARDAFHRAYQPVDGALNQGPWTSTWR